MKLGDWPRKPLVAEPRRPYLENVRYRATNRAPEGVTVELYDQDADSGVLEAWEGNQ